MAQWKHLIMLFSQRKIQTIKWKKSPHEVEQQQTGNKEKYN